jgi:hypothetical protein
VSLLPEKSRRPTSKSFINNYLDTKSIETMVYEVNKKKLKKMKKVSEKRVLSLLKTRGYNPNRNKHLGLDFCTI